MEYLANLGPFWLYLFSFFIFLGIAGIVNFLVAVLPDLVGDLVNEARQKRQQQRERQRREERDRKYLANRHIAYRFPQYTDKPGYPIFCGQTLDGSKQWCEEHKPN